MLPQWMEVVDIDDDTAIIQWNWIAGDVRAKSDSRTEWTYATCSFGENAYKVGKQIIECQRNGNNEPRFYGS
jgi:hypothetical protein